MPPLAAVQPHPEITASTMQRQPRNPLRRAVYIHVSDLTSAYNIDHLKLEQELARVLANRNAKDAATTPDEETPFYHRSPASSADAGGSVMSIPQKRLQPPRGGFNLCVLVGKVKIVVNKLRVDRSRVRLAEVEVGDETGTVSLRARDDQIDMLQEVSDRSGAVVLRNCTLELYQGRHIRLAVTKWGKMSTYPDQVASTPPPPSKMNKDRNFSLIDLSLVASEMVDHPSPEAGFLPSQKTPEREADSRTQSTSKSMSVRQQQFQSQQQQSRKGGRDRKQQRQQKVPQRPLGYQDTGVSGPMTGFPAMHTFSPSYAEALEVPHYSYPSPPHRPQEGPGLSQASQHLLLHQYELQQRQMQHMQMYQEHQERQRRMLSGQQQQRHQMQPSSVLLPGIVGSGSFDHSGDYPVSSLSGGTGQHPSVVPVVGTSQLLIPVSVAGSPTRAPASSQESSGQQQQKNFADIVAGHRGGSGSQQQRGQAASSQGSSFTSPDAGQSQETAWSGEPPTFHTPRAESPGSPGRMNPQATAFAPSYMQSQGYAYVPYDPSQTAPGNLYGSLSPQQHPSMYAQGGVVYVPAVHAVTGASQNTEQSQETRAREFQPIEGSMEGEGDTANRAPGTPERETRPSNNGD